MLGDFSCEGERERGMSAKPVPRDSGTGVLQVGLRGQVYPAAGLVSSRRPEFSVLTPTEGDLR